MLVYTCAFLFIFRKKSPQIWTVAVRSRGFVRLRAVLSEARAPLSAQVDGTLFSLRTCYRARF